MGQKKDNYFDIFKEEVVFRFKKILRILDEQDSDSKLFKELTFKLEVLTKEFNSKLTKKEAIEKFNEILKDMTLIRKQLYSFEKADMLIVEYCDNLNEFFGKKIFNFEINIIRKEKLKKTKSKENTRRVEFVKKPKRKRHILKISLILLIISFGVLFIIPSGEVREYTEHIFPRSINTTVNVSEDISLLKYQQPEQFDNTDLSLKGHLEYISELDKDNFSKFNRYLIDASGQKILLEYVNREFQSLFVKNNITKGMYEITGRYQYKIYPSGKKGPTLDVKNIVPTTILVHEELISKRLPAEDIIKEKELTVGMLLIYSLIE